MAAYDLQATASNMPPEAPQLGDVASKDHPAAEAESASGLRATADTLQPRTLLVQVCEIEANDAAVYSPLGNMATGNHPAQAEKADKLQAVADKVEHHPTWTTAVDMLPRLRTTNSSGEEQRTRNT
jgi:hypothetical protein